MEFVDLVLRWVHILSAILLVGGAFFWKFVWQPTAASLSEQVRQEAFEGLRSRWAMLVHVGITLLLVTGLLNAVRIIRAYRFPDTPYDILVAIKLVLALILSYIAMRLAGRSEGAKRFRANGTWLTVNVVLATLIVCLAGYMKSVGRVPKNGEEAMQSKSVTVGANQLPR